MNIEELLIKHEGLRTTAYTDSLGVWTVGVGHNLQAKPLSMQAVQQILHDDIADSIEDCKGFYWFEGLDEVRQAVVIDMVFNMGIAGFKHFKKTIDHIAMGMYQHAAAEMLDSRWAYQVGKRAEELSKMMTTGKWEV